ncbi:hypothetical protein TNCV_5105061 [Trichonephila clavipes]|nr:hypothetical protein TNCV_5105061 [Trichonephila clavipes]
MATKVASDAPAYSLQAPLDLRLKRGEPFADLLHSPITNDWGCERGPLWGFKGSACLFTRASSRSFSIFCSTFHISIFLARRHSIEVAGAPAPQEPMDRH